MRLPRARQGPRRSCRPRGRERASPEALRRGVASVPRGRGDRSRWTASVTNTSSRFGSRSSATPSVARITSRPGPGGLVSIHQSSIRCGAPSASVSFPKQSGLVHRRSSCLHPSRGQGRARRRDPRAADDRRAPATRRDRCSRTPRGSEGPARGARGPPRGARGASGPPRMRCRATTARPAAVPGMRLVHRHRRREGSPLRRIRRSGVRTRRVARTQAS